jgi:hypothetical protein
MNTQEPQLGHVAKFPSGYGSFPYIILKVNYAVYMQIPIQINAPQLDIDQYPGSYLDGVSEEAITRYAVDKNSELHELLLQHCREWKRKTEFYNKGKTIKLCLVTGPDRAHYFQNDEELVHTSIPSGGTLLSIRNEVIAMNVPHFIPITN